MAQHCAGHSHQMVALHAQSSHLPGCLLSPGQLSPGASWCRCHQAHEPAQPCPHMTRPVRMSVNKPLAERPQLTDSPFRKGSRHQLGSACTCCTCFCRLIDANRVVSAVSPCCRQAAAPLTRHDRALSALGALSCAGPARQQVPQAALTAARGCSSTHALHLNVCRGKHDAHTVVWC